MALTIEDGTGVTGADSFATLAEFASIQTDLFAGELTGSDTDKEAALRRAFLYMCSLSWTAASEFPTFGGTIPDEIKKAQVVFARAEQQAPNALQPSVNPSQQKILTRVGDIGWTSLARSGVDAQRIVVTMALDLLKRYISGTGSTKFLARG